MKCLTIKMRPFLLELKRQLDETSKEKHKIEKNYEWKMQEVISEMEQEKATRVLLNKQVSAMEFTIHKLEGEKHTTTMEVQVKATPSESDVGSLKGVLRQKDREIEDLKGKLKALGGDIGEYLVCVSSSSVEKKKRKSKKPRSV